MIPILDKNEESGIGGYVYGMNTVDDPRDLVQGECQRLENCLPGKRMTARNAIVDLFTSTTLLGRGTEQTAYSPHSVLISNPDGEDYIFVWTQQFVSTDVFQIESIKVSDGTRAALMTAKFSSTETICSMLKLYSSVYCAFSHSVVENYTNTYLVNNIIIYWNTDTSAWALRSWGIDHTPLMSALTCVDTSGSDTLDKRTGCAATVAGSQVCLTMGTTAARKNDVLTTVDMSLWNSKDVEAIEQLLDEDGNPFIEPMIVAADWDGRDGHRMVFFQDKIWMMGGETDSGLMNDLWFTEDYGETWYRHITECDWTARRDFAVVVFGGKIFLLGGYDASGANDEVWSFDGDTWTEESTTGFNARYSHEAVVYDNKIWVAMGNGSTDVINSSDGLTWTEITADASLGARENFGLISHDNKMWVVGGYNGSAYLKNVYYSTDGVTWTVATAAADWTERSGHITLSFAGKMYITCGYDGSNYLSDTWYSEDGADWFLVAFGLTQNKYYGYAFTIVRRDDALARLESMTTYNYQSWETLDGRIVTGIDEKLLTGTVSLSGTALTGTGTLFESEISAGDRIRCGGAFEYVTIVSVTDGTNAVVSNDNGYAYTDVEFALLPANNDYITTMEYNPGVDESPEITSIRQVVQCVCTTDYGRTIIPLPVLTEATAKGGTHLRIYRTTGADTSVIAAGLDLLFLVDIAIDTDTYSTVNVYRDELSDGIQETETHTVETNGYAVCPFGKFSAWDRERMWLSTGEGFWLFSVGASQDVEYPQKYASLFNGSTQRIVCDPENGQLDTGSILHEGNLYTFKERMIHVLDESNPVNIPRDVSNGIGCDFPNTITHVDHPVLGKVMLFLSNSGPAMLRSGGVIELLNRFKLEELWPDGYLHVDPSTGLARSTVWKEKVCARWYKNAWRIFVPGQTIPTIYCFYADPTGDDIGSFIDTLASDSEGDYVCDPVDILVKNDHVAYSLSNKTNIYRLSQFLKSGVFQDLFESESCSYHQKMHNRKRGLTQSQTVMGELSDILIHCEMKDTDGLDVTAYCDNNRFSANMVYSENIDTALEAAGYDDLRTMIQGILLEGAYGRCFSVLVDKVVPDDGSFSFSGVDMDVMPQEAFGSEFYGVFSERVKGWA